MCLASCRERPVFKVPPCRPVCRDFIPLYGCPPSAVWTPHTPSVLPAGGRLDGVDFLAVASSTAANSHAQVLTETDVSSSPGRSPRPGIAGSSAAPSDRLRTRQMAFQSGRRLAGSHRQPTRALTRPRPRRQVPFLTLAPVRGEGGKRHLSVALIFVSLVRTNFEHFKFRVAGTRVFGTLFSLFSVRLYVVLKHVACYLT